MSQGQKSPHEDFLLVFMVAVIIACVSWALWHFFHYQLTNFVRAVRIGELELIRLLYGDNTQVSMADMPPQITGEWRKWLWKAPVEEITVDAIKASTHIAVQPLRIVFVALMGIMGLIITFKGPNSKYRRRMGLEGLMAEQSKSFPGLTPLLKFDPRKVAFRAPGEPVPSQLPLFSEALTPEEWLAFHEISYVGGQLDMNKAFYALVEQLGERWQGPQKLPLHMQGLFAAFALKHVRRRKESDDLLNDLAIAWSPTGGFKPKAKTVSQIKKIINNPKIGGMLQKHADQHAYTTTAMLRALSAARQEGGVLAPAQFLWLRGHDRILWYPLNNLGRKSYHAEASGAMVHYTNELIAAQKIPTPRFEEVIRGLETYMKSGAARSIPELDKKNAGFKSWKK